MRVLVETSALVALVLRKDQNHRAAKRYLETLPASTTLLTTDYVSDETVTRLRRVAGHTVARSVGEALRNSALARLIPAEPDDWDEAWTLFTNYADHELSFTDCTTAAAARRLGIDQVFAFDEDFRTLGLSVVP